MDVKNAGNIDFKKGTYLIYGVPGIGKTSTIKFLPGKTLLIDIDKTSRVLAGESNIDIVDIDVIDIWKSYNNILKELMETDLSKYDNIVIDNISELERCILSNLGREGRNGRVPSQGDYQKMHFFIVDSIRYLKKLDKNIILTAWETTDSWTDEDGRVYNRAFPQIANKILSNVMGLCDVVGRLYYDTKNEKRGFYLMPTNQIYAKNQIDNRKGCLQEELIIND